MKSHAPGATVFLWFSCVDHVTFKSPCRDSNVEPRKTARVIEREDMVAKNHCVFKRSLSGFEAFEREDWAYGPIFFPAQKRNAFLAGSFFRRVLTPGTGKKIAWRAQKEILGAAFVQIGTFIN